MWLLKNETPLAAERSWTRGKGGEHTWIVSARATYNVRDDGSLVLAEEQPPPVLIPEYRGEPGVSSLAYDSDLLLVKPATDILVNASAYAPNARPATKVDVCVRVADVAKTLVVYGERTYSAGLGLLSVSSPRPFVSRPLIYEVAFGGTDLADPDPRRHRMDLRNPVGRGIASSAEQLDGKPVHSVEYPSGDPSKVGPAGFGPIDLSWTPRVQLAGTYGAAWEATRRPLLPADYDERYALAAPRDQWSRHGWLRGGETVELTNLSPRGVWKLDLPRVELRFSTRVAGRIEEHVGRLASVILEPDENRLILVWQTALVIPASDVEYLDETTVREAP
jgi:hypothetical protein